MGRSYKNKQADKAKQVMPNIAIRYYAKQQNGELVIRDAEIFRQDLRRMADNELEVTIKPWRNSRSDNQNRYYWGIVIKIIAEETGMLPLQVHELMKEQFLREMAYMKTKSGIKEVSIPGSSASLYTSEFEQYLSDIRAWASEFLGAWIPLPNEAEVY